MLRNYRYFPNFKSLPTIHFPIYIYDDFGVEREASSWFFLAEVIDDSTAQMAFARNRVSAKDIDGNQFYIAFYPEEGKFDFATLKRGSVVRIDNGESKLFLDGTCGLRIEDLDSIRAYPISFDKLKKIDEMVANEEISLTPEECWACHKMKTEPEVRLSVCGRCKFASYCSQDCQKEDWTNHKVSCKGTS